MLLTKAGVIFSFGAGSSGQLGHDDVNDDDDRRFQFEPRIIRRLQGAKVSAIAIGWGGSSYAVATDGTTYGWGNGGGMTLGLRHSGNRHGYHFTPLQYPAEQLRVQVV
jgi:E3 ubiquitin-protein ligase HERC3